MSHALIDPLGWALAAFRDSSLAESYTTASDYYNGHHDLGFATTAYHNTFRDLLKATTCNRCRSVVDAHADRLKVIGFSDEGTEERSPETADDTPADVASGKAPREMAWDLWRQNRMDKRAGEIHQEAFTTGDAYVIVDKHPTTGVVNIWPQLASQIRVAYNDEHPGAIDLAAKKWRLHNGKARLNLYFEDRIEKYVSRNKEANTGAMLPKAFERYTDKDDAGAWPLRLITPGIPVFHFGNNARTGEYGTSELVDVIPLQDDLNKTIADMMVAGEFGAFRQRWAVGVSPVIDPITGLEALPFKAGPGQVWFADADADGTAPKFGDFTETDITQYIDEKETFSTEIARVSRVPVHYLLMTGTPPSGESLKLLEAPFVAKLQDRQIAFGQVWGDVIRYALLLQSGVDVPGLVTEWQPASPRSEKETADLALIYSQVGWPEEELWRFMGKTDAEIARMKAEKATAFQQQQQIAAQTQATFERSLTGFAGPDQNPSAQDSQPNDTPPQKERVKPSPP